MKPRKPASLIKYSISRREFNTGYRISSPDSKETLAKVNSSTYYNLETCLYGYSVEIRKGGITTVHYKIMIDNSVVKLEFKKFRNPFFYLDFNGKKKQKFKWKFRKFLFFKSPMKLYVNKSLVAKYAISVFPTKKMGVLKLYKSTNDFEKAVIIATSMCIVHYDSRK
eukprot:NODE_370_length_9954_cov_0.501776.p6 type:complete len:167 gc:universal NODE_370_length_9954_cov_0.501776:9134-9634(+)